MAVVHNRSTTILNTEDITGITRNESFVAGGRVRSAAETMAITASNSDGSTLRFFRVKSSWRIEGLWLAADASVVSTDVDIGLYAIADDGGAVIDKDAYVDGLDLSGGSAYPFTNLAFHTRDITKVKQQVWQDAGLSADPRKHYDLTVTLNTIGAAAGDFAMILNYIED